MSEGATMQWWLVVVGRTLMWARLRELEAGTADVLDCDGRTLVYESPDAARAALMDADYRAFDGLDAADAADWGLDIGAITPPDADDEARLQQQMTRSLNPPPD